MSDDEDDYVEPTRHIIDAGVALNMLTGEVLATRVLLGLVASEEVSHWGELNASGVLKDNGIRVYSLEKFRRLELTRRDALKMFDALKRLYDEKGWDYAGVEAEICSAVNQEVRASVELLQEAKEWKNKLQREREGRNWGVMVDRLEGHIRHLRELAHQGFTDYGKQVLDNIVREAERTPVVIRARRNDGGAAGGAAGAADGAGAAFVDACTI